jgi:hypothetical protein
MWTVDYKLKKKVQKLIFGDELRGPQEIKLKVKVKFTLEQATRTQRGSKVVALLFL